MTIDHNYFLFIFQTFYVYKIIKYNLIIPEIGTPKYAESKREMQKQDYLNPVNYLNI